MTALSEVEESLQAYGVMVTNSHVVLTSGKHSSAYFDKNAIYPHTALIRELGKLLAYEFAGISEIDAVLAPAVGGVALSQWTAYALGQIRGHEVLALHADIVGEDDAGRNVFAIRRGYDIKIRGKKVLALEDVLTTGDSVLKVIAAARACEAEIIAAGALCNRGGITRAMIGNPPILKALWNLKLDAWDADQCLLCKADVPVNTDVGKGHEFLAKRGRRIEY